MFQLHCLIVTMLLVLVHSSLFDPSANMKLEQMRVRANMVHEQLLQEGCPDPEQTTIKRALLATSKDELLIDFETKFYHKLLDYLIECRKNKLSSSAGPLSIDQSSTDPTTTTPPVTWTTTTNARPTIQSTTSIPVPTQCKNAINLTEDWRQDHKGRKIYPINGQANCDTRDMAASGRPWFRFSAAAGNRLINKCVPQWSCGTNIGLWSNDTMPTSLAILKSIEVYGSFGSSCDIDRTFKVSVMRCSVALYDYVYRYDDAGVSCSYGFCGMSV